MFLLYGILAAALFTDFRKLRIPNSLIVWGIIAGIGHSIYREDIWYIALFDGLFALILLYPLYVIGAFGGGDVKLLSVIGIFLGIENTINIVILALMAGAVCSVIKILFLLFREKRLSFKNLYIHFSLPILIGTILVHFGGITWITF